MGLKGPNAMAVNGKVDAHYAIAHDMLSQLTLLNARA